MQAPKLRRGPFGFTSRSVHLVLADRDASLAQATERAGAAEAHVLDLRSEAERLKTQLADQAEQLRAQGAEAADLRTDRDAARRELEGAVADSVRLQLQLTAARRQLETIQNDREAIQLGSEAGRGGPDVTGTSEPGSGEIALIREELTSARRQFLIQSQQIRSAEARIEVLETEVRSLRPELEAGLSAAVADLQAARAAVDEVAARAESDPSVTAEAAEELAQAELGRHETVVEIERLAASRDRLASLVGEVRSTIEDAGEGAGGIGDRVDEAVAPLTGAIDELNLRLAAFGELGDVSSEDTRDLASERPLNLVRLEDQDDAADRPDPADGVGSRTSDDLETDEAAGPAFEWIVPPAPPPVDRAHRSG